MPADLEPDLLSELFDLLPELLDLVSELLLLDFELPLPFESLLLLDLVSELLLLDFELPSPFESLLLLDLVSELLDLLSLSLLDLLSELLDLLSDLLSDLLLELVDLLSESFVLVAELLLDFEPELLVSFLLSLLFLVLIMVWPFKGFVSRRQLGRRWRVFAYSNPEKHSESHASGYVIAPRKEILELVVRAPSRDHDTGRRSLDEAANQAEQPGYKVGLSG